MLSKKIKLNDGDCNHLEKKYNDYLLENLVSKYYYFIIFSHIHCYLEI